MDRLEEERNKWEKIQPVHDKSDCGLFVQIWGGGGGGGGVSDLFS